MAIGSFLGGGLKITFERGWGFSRLRSGARRSDEVRPIGSRFLKTSAKWRAALCPLERGCDTLVMRQTRVRFGSLKDSAMRDVRFGPIADIISSIGPSHRRQLASVARILTWTLGSNRRSVASSPTRLCQARWLTDPSSSRLQE